MLEIQNCNSNPCWQLVCHRCRGERNQIYRSCIHTPQWPQWPESFLPAYPLSPETHIHLVTHCWWQLCDHCPWAECLFAHFILLVSLGAYRVFLDSWVLYVLTPHHEVPRPQYQIVVAQSFPTRGIIPTMGHCARGRGTEQWHCNWGVYCIFATLLSSPSLLFNRAACSLIFFMNFRKGGGGSIPIQRNVGNFPLYWGYIWQLKRVKPQNVLKKLKLEFLK